MAANLPTDCRQVPKERLQPCFPLGMTRHRDPDWPHNAFVGQQPVPQGEPCMSCHSAPWPTLLCTCWRRLRALRGDETRACRARWSRLMIAILNPAGAIADTNTPVERIRRCWGEWFSDFLWRCDIKSKACVWDVLPPQKKSYTTPHYDPKYVFFAAFLHLIKDPNELLLEACLGKDFIFCNIFSSGAPLVWRRAVNVGPPPPTWGTADAWGERWGGRGGVSHR